MKVQQEILRKVVNFGLIISRLTQVPGLGAGKPSHLLPSSSEVSAAAHS